MSKNSINLTCRGKKNACFCFTDKTFIYFLTKLSWEDSKDRDKKTPQEILKLVKIQGQKNEFKTCLFCHGAAQMFHQNEASRCRNKR